MAVSYINDRTYTSFTSAATVRVYVSAYATVGDLLVVVFAFEGVSSGSGPWAEVTPADAFGWRRETYQAPSNTGCGIEIWSANLISGTHTDFDLNGSLTGIVTEVAYECSGVPTVVQSATAQSVGDNPSCPSITTTYADTLVVACAALTLSGTGFGPAPGFTEIVDNAHNGTFGNAEVHVSEKEFATPGATGTIGLTAPASPADAAGATATLGLACLGGFVPQIIRRR